MGVRGVKTTGQGRSEKSGDGKAPACENHDDVAVDCEALGDGSVADSRQRREKGDFEKSMNVENSRYAISHL